MAADGKKADARLKRHRCAAVRAIIPSGGVAVGWHGRGGVHGPHWSGSSPFWQARCEGL